MSIHAGITTTHDRGTGGQGGMLAISFVILLICTIPYECILADMKIIPCREMIAVTHCDRNMRRGGSLTAGHLQPL